MPVRDNKIDIVDRLRRNLVNQKNQMDAAEEIEKLRRRLLAEENAYDIMRLENELLRKERDEARRLYCEEWAFTIELERGEASDPRDLAEEKKWDCYKETHNER